MRSRCVAFEYAKTTVSPGASFRFTLWVSSVVRRRRCWAGSVSTVKSFPTCGSQRACVGSRHRLWGEAERRQPRPCPGSWGAWARHMPSEPQIPACEVAPLSCCVCRPFSFPVKVCSIPLFLARVHALCQTPKGEAAGVTPANRWRKLSWLEPGVRVHPPPQGGGQLCWAHLRGCFSPGRESCEQRESPVEAGPGMSATELIIPTAAGSAQGNPTSRRGSGFCWCGAFFSTQVFLLSLKLCRVNGNPLTCSGRNQAIVLRPLRRSTSGRTCGVL